MAEVSYQVILKILSPDFQSLWYLCPDSTSAFMGIRDNFFYAYFYGEMIPSRVALIFQIQANVRILTQERDNMKLMYDEVRLRILSLENFKNFVIKSSSSFILTTSFSSTLS